MKIVRVAVVSVALVLLNGCANYWLKPGATKQSFNNDKAQCMAQAYLAAPIKNTPVHLGSGYTTPSSATCIDYGNIVNCTDPGTYVPPTLVPFDTNTHTRAAMVDACMRAGIRRSTWGLAAVLPRLHRRRSLGRATCQKKFCSRFRASVLGWTTARAVSDCATLACA